MQMSAKHLVGLLPALLGSWTAAQQPSDSKFDHSKVDQTEFRRLEKIDKPVEKDVVGNVILGGGPIKAAASGVTAAGKALATGIATSGAVTAAKKKINEYRRAKKINMKAEKELPDSVSSSSSSTGSQR